MPSKNGQEKGVEEIKKIAMGSIYLFQGRGLGMKRNSSLQNYGSHFPVIVSGCIVVTYFEQSKLSV